MTEKIWKRRWNGELPGNTAVDPQLGEVPAVIRNFLVGRGWTDPSQWKELFLPNTLELKNPLTMKGASEALDRLTQALKEQETICLYADFDLDGTSGLALALDGFRQLGFKNVIPYQPLRLKDGYGFHSFAVEDLKTRGVSLIVTIDVGITALEACATARNLGVDVIITDHHQAGAQLPDALTVVNPNQPGCPSGLGYLCGAGVIFYMIRAMARQFVDLGLIQAKQLSLKSLLDLLTIAAVTDMVPLIEDNRVLVKQGLKALAQTNRPGLQALMKALKISGDTMTTADVGIRLAPKLNALSRLEGGIRPLDLYLAPTYEDAENLVEEVLSTNSDRLDYQSFGENLAVDLLQDWPHQEFVLAVSKDFHRGVVGLIATKLAGLFNRPAYVGSIGDDGAVVGSARTPNGSMISVLAGLEAAAPALNRFGGHRPAAGFEVMIEKVPQMVEHLSQHFKSLGNGPILQVTEYDLELQAKDLSLGLVKWIQSLEPFGVGFAAPVFRINGLTIDSFFKIKNTHWKFVLDGTEAIFFSPPENLQFRKGQVVSVLGELQVNSFRSSKSLQIVIKDLIFDKDQYEERRPFERGP